MDAFSSSSLRGWKLETSYDDTGQRYHQRPSGNECWRPEKGIGNGTFGDVWEERCVSGPALNTIRAVKQLHKRQSKFLEMSRRELDALVTFSDSQTIEVNKNANQVQKTTNSIAVQAAFCPISWLVRRYRLFLYRNGILGIW